MTHRCVRPLQNSALSSYNNRAWNAYEVFLKASRVLLREQARDNDLVSTILLLRMVDLYRRRPSRLHQAAARECLDRLQRQLAGQAPHGRAGYLTGRVTYHAAYLRFLINAAHPDTASLFEESARLEGMAGRPIGQLMSRGQSLVARARQGLNLSQTFDELERVREAMAGEVTIDATRWAEENVPIHLAAIALALGEPASAAELLEPLVVAEHHGGVGRGTRPAKALYLYGVAFADEGSLDEARACIEQAKRAYRAASATEGYAAVLVSLGDVALSSGDEGSAREHYLEATRQSASRDNAKAIGAAIERLREADRGEGRRNRRVYRAI